MGALHRGHVSLVKKCSSECGFCVVSIFVNPTQFGPKEDFGRYPRTLEKDLDHLAGQGVDLVFAPSVEDMYPQGFCTSVQIAGEAEPLEGQFRPGHFAGVATIVLKLFQVVAPDVAYFGQKDYQQTVILRRLVKDLNLPVEIRVCPTVRESDGLALSSRNIYLGPSAREQALVLHQSLQQAKSLVERGERDASAILRQCRELFEGHDLVTLQYFCLVDPRTLRDIPRIEGTTLAITAAIVDGTRLIDNQLIRDPRSPSGDDLGL